MQPFAGLIFGACLAVCQAVIGSQFDINHALDDDLSMTVPTIASTLTSTTITHLGTVYVVVDEPTTPYTGTDPGIKEREASNHGFDDQVEATVVVATVPPALSTLLSPQDASAQVTALTDSTTTPTVVPGGSYGGGGSNGAGSGPSGSPGDSSGNNPSGGSGAGPGGDTGNNPTGGAPGSGTGGGPDNGQPGSSQPSGVQPGSGQPGGSQPGSGNGNGGGPNLPSGAYGQPLNTAGQQRPNPTNGQSPNPANQPPNTEGQQPPNPTGGLPQGPAGEQSPNPTGEQSPNPAGQQPLSTNGQQPSNPSITSPGSLVTTISLEGTAVETVTVSLAFAPSNGQFSIPCNPATGVCGPLSIPTAQTLPTTFLTIQAGSPPSAPCESDTVPWGPLSAPNTPALPTISVTVPGAGGPSPITTSSTLNIVTVTVPGSQGQTSTLSPAGSTTTPNIPGWTTIPNTPGWTITPNGPGLATTPNTPGWATVPKTTLTVPNSPQTGATGLQPFSSTCTTGIYTDVISAAPTPGITTAAATMAVGSSTSSRYTTWSFETFVTGTPTISRVAEVNAGIPTIKFSLSTICSAMISAFLTSIIATI